MSTMVQRPGQADLRVIGMGWGRTGTMSLRAAFRILGLGPCYHMEEVLDSGGKDIPHWYNIHNGVNPTENFDKIFKEFHSTTDHPASNYPDELYAAYPNAKFVLTVRDPEKYYQSVMDTIYKIAHSPSLYTLSWILPSGWKFYSWVHYTLWGPSGIFKGRFEEDGRELFVGHNEHVKNLVPEKQLLVFEPKHGWGPLCEFLELPVPDVPFPHVNDTREFQERIEGLGRVAMAVQAVGIALVATAGYFAFDRLQQLI